MFKSKQRPIAIAQSEHQKLAGTLALLWGNAAFDRPAVPRMSFLAGIGLHDRAYGVLDNLPIGELPDEEWLALTRSGFEMTWADPIADLITKMHLKRLVGYGTSPAHQAMTDQMTQAIREQLLRHNLELTTFERIDRITNLCDRIAFDFCFEAPAEGVLRIFPRNDSQDQVEVWYGIEDGTIQVDPWPFGLDSQIGYLIGYQLDGYPTVLEPAIVPYQVVWKTTT
ncbi:MAG TPA: DUF3891 family protein [Herpetosiphonaceae bacterium]